MRIRGFIVPIVAVVVLTAACGGADPPPPPAPTGPSQEELDRRAAEEAARQAEADRRAEEQRQREGETARQAEMRRLRTTLTERIHFEYDMSDITSESERKLRAKVDILRNSTDIRIRLEGHADERGSGEYNQALGSRRAQSVRDFLAGFGVSANRFAMVSFGEERPLVNRSDEAAWAQNRRVEFIITAGQIRVSDPDDRP